MTKLHQLIVDNIERLSIEEGRKILNAQANERAVQSAICDYLRVQQVPFAVTDATEAFNRHGQRVMRVNRGWPDITCCLPARLDPTGKGGIFAAIECKRPAGGQLSFEQAWMLDSIRKTGGLVVIARSVDCVIAAIKSGVRPCDIDEIERAMARGAKPGGGNGLRSA